MDPRGNRVASVQVERVDDGRLAVTWAYLGDSAEPVRVEVAVGSPDAPADQVAVASASAGQVVFADIPPHPRPWCRLSFGDGPHLLAAERRLPVSGTLNFRDLGGYPTLDGRRTRWGHVFRSDNFADVPPSSWRQLQEMGLREVFDLRHDAERERSPSTVPDDLDIAVSVLAIGGEAAEAPDVVDLLAGGRPGGFGLDFMVTMYRELVAQHAPTFSELLTHLADPDRLPAVFHCTAGKDRTGVAAALLLMVLDVDPDVVLDDYELSTQYRTEARIAALRPRLREAGVDVEDVRLFLSAPRPALASALTAVEDDYGSVEAFLLAHGLDQDVPSRLRATLLEA